MILYRRQPHLARADALGDEGLKNEPLYIVEGITQSERVEIGRALEGELREKAEARMKAGVANPKENFPEGVGQSRDLAAKAAGFGNGKTYRLPKSICPTKLHHATRARWHVFATHANSI